MKQIHNTPDYGVVLDHNGRATVMSEHLRVEIHIRDADEDGREVVADLKVSAAHISDVILYEDTTLPYDPRDYMGYDPTRWLKDAVDSAVNHANWSLRDLAKFAADIERC